MFSPLRWSHNHCGILPNNASDVVISRHWKNPNWDILQNNWPVTLQNCLNNEIRGKAEELSQIGRHQNSVEDPRLYPETERKRKLMETS